jgi:hypothetical protein
VLEPSSHYLRSICMQSESMCGTDLRKASLVGGGKGFASVVLGGGVGDVITKWQPNYSSFSLGGVITQRGKFILGPNLSGTIP